MNETDKLIEEQFGKLPKNLQGAINAVPWKSFVQEIGKANLLDTEQITLLEQETMFIIYGFEPPDDFVSNITNGIGVGEEVAMTIAESIARKIFDPILKKSEELGNNNVGGVKSALVNTPEITPEILPEIPPEDLPAVIPEEKVHEVVITGQQPTQQIKTQQTSYPAGQDPYREPIQ